MSNFLKEAADAAKSVDAARKTRAKMETTANARFEKAQEAYNAAKAAHAEAEEEAKVVEAHAWVALMDKLNVNVDVAAQIGGVEPAHVKAVIGALERRKSDQ